jgi:uncharacterized protein (DUF58 family)
MVREFEREHTRRTAIVIDTSADEGKKDTALDRACSVAASVAFASLARGRGVRLAAGIDAELETLTRAEPGRMLRWLAELRPFGGLSIPEVCRRLSPELRGIETLLLIVPTWRSNRDVVAPIAGLATHVPGVAVALVGALRHAERGRGSIALAEDQEELLAAELLAAGVDVYRVVRGKELSACLGRPTIAA